MIRNSIYLDHAATTPTDKKVVEKMLPYFGEIFANPSSICQAGIKARQAIDGARKITADFLNCKPEEIIFTGGGTESDNLAILGSARAMACHSERVLESRNPSIKGSLHAGRDDKKTPQSPAPDKRPHIITTQIEHSAVLNSCKQLEKEGFEVTYLPVLENGIVSVDEVKKALRPETILVSVMYANNEIGTIQPIAKIFDAIKNFRKNAPRPTPHAPQVLPFFHTDACQATEYLEMDVEKLGCDLLTINGSKIYGPKGVGALHVRDGVELEPIIHGGHQENNLRAGTENVPGIVGFGEALRQIKNYDGEKTRELRDYFISELLKIDGTELNGDAKDRLPNNVNISFAGVEGEAAILYLDREGVCLSTGSACLSQSLEPSHVITALGKDEEIAHSSLRFTLGRSTTKEQLDETVEKVKEVVAKLRQISTL